MSARLYIPRLLVAIVGGMGAALLVGGGRAALARVSLLGEAPDGLALAFVGGLVFAVIAVTAGLALVWTAVRWGRLSVTVSGEGVLVRTVRGRRRITSEALRGVVLRQDGGVPQLRLVLRDGEPVVLPGWSLRARWDDGEVDDAGPVLRLLGAEHGFGVKLLTILGTPPAAPR